MSCPNTASCSPMPSGPSRRWTGSTSPSLMTEASSKPMWSWLRGPDVRDVAALGMIGLLALLLALVLHQEPRAVISCTRDDTGVICRTEDARDGITRHAEIDAAGESHVVTSFPGSGELAELAIATGNTEPTPVYYGKLTRADADAAVKKLDAFFADRSARSTEVRLEGRPQEALANVLRLLLLVVVGAWARALWRQGPARPAGPSTAASVVLALVIGMLLPLFVIADLHGARRSLECTRGATCAVERRSLLAPTRIDVDARRVIGVHGLVDADEDGEPRKLRLSLSLDADVPVRVDDERDRHVALAYSETIDHFARLPLMRSMRISFTPLLARGPAGAAALALLLAALVWSRRRTRSTFGNRPLLVAAGLLVVGAVAPPGRPVWSPLVDPPERENMRITVRGMEPVQADAPIELFAAAGDHLTLDVAAWTSLNRFEPVHGETRWSVSPSTAASIGPASGVLAIANDAPDGAVLEVRAEIGGDRPPLDARVHVYRGDVRPLIGSWRHLAEISCLGEWRLTDQRTILHFRADGRFVVDTGRGYPRPGELGTYEHHRSSGTLTLRIDSASEVPPGFDGDGVMTVQPAAAGDPNAVDILYIEGISLGDGVVPSQPAMCKHMFRRLGRSRWGQP
ncbi:Hypothetical protein A7982_00508 [Minicystis rosea]|nr:Hypothetical protein A7982_00508 [Minicystis rosea]